MIMMLGDSANVEYETGMKTTNKLRDTMLAKFTVDYEKKLAETEDILKEDKEVKEEDTVEEDKAPTGLMARRK
jgi:hypothetical protein